MPRKQQTPPPLLRYRPLPCLRTPRALPARQSRSREKRERLLWALESVIRDVGIQRATVRAIAARAGVAVGTLYRRFPDKQALIDALQARIVARRVRRLSLSVSLARNRDHPAKLARVINGALLEIERDRRLLSAFLEVSCPERELFAAYGPLLRRASEAPPTRIDRRLNLVLLLLRSLVVDPQVPSGRAWSRHELTSDLLLLLLSPDGL